MNATTKKFAMNSEELYNHLFSSFIRTFNSYPNTFDVYSDDRDMRLLVLGNTTSTKLLRPKDFIKSPTRWRSVIMDRLLGRVL